MPYTKPVCRGSWALGSACGKCERCEATRPHVQRQTLSPAARTFQERVGEWVTACFGSEVAADRIERNHCFLEEALELVQATGCSASEAHQLVDYVFGRPMGEQGQEVGGVMNTLAALCNAHGLDLNAEAERELARVWTISDKIRAKHEAKPRHSPLPGLTAPAPREQAREILDRIVVYRIEQDDRIHLSVMGRHIDGWPSQSLEAVALLRLEAELSDFRRGART